jgi:hypothetical protein
VNVSAWVLKYAGKPIQRSARNGLSGQTKAPNQENPELMVIKNMKNKRQKTLRRTKKLKKEV